jgi:hypothetical protein
VHIWGADLRPANSPSNIPAYQRVNTATDYDTVGFTPYLKFDGGDSLSSGAVTLGSNMDCFMVVRRDSASNAVLASQQTGGAKFFGYYEDTTGMTVQGAGESNSTYVNGALVGGSAATPQQLKNALTVGAWNVLEVRNLDLSSWTLFGLSVFSGYQLVGAIPETILTPALTPTERTQLRQALAAKYGITLA